MAVSERSLSNLRPWTKGRTGNGNGRPNKYHEVLHACRLAGPECVRVLRRCVNDEDAPWNVRVLAANSLLDRGFGKPKEHVETNGGTGVPALRNEFVSAQQHTEREAIDGEALPLDDPLGKK